MKIDKNDPVNKIIFPDKSNGKGCLLFIMIFVLILMRIYG